MLNYIKSIEFNKFYQVMSKDKSSGQEEISKYCFAAFPLTIHFQQPCMKKLSLYLQKNLQIIAKYPTTNLDVKKGEIYTFEMPTTAQIFRAWSEKKLTYNLSVYEMKEQNGEQSQLLIESKELALKQIWDKWQGRKQKHQGQQQQFLKTIQFTSLKCRINVLISISNSKKQALNSIQEYYQYKIKQISSSINMVTSESKNIHQASQKMKNQFYSLNYLKGDNIIQHPLQIQEVNDHKQTLKKSECMKVDTSKKQQTKNVRTPKKQNNRVRKDEKAIKLINIGDSHSLGQDIDRPLNLTQSEKHLSIEIESIVKEGSSPKHKSNILQGPTKQNSIKLTCSSVASQQEEYMKKSQYINKKGQLVIIPFYKQTKYIVIIIAILFIFSFLIFMRPQFKSFDNLTKQDISWKKKSKQKPKTIIKYIKNKK